MVWELLTATTCYNKVLCCVGGGGIMSALVESYWLRSHKTIEVLNFKFAKLQSNKQRSTYNYQGSHKTKTTIIKSFKLQARGKAFILSTR